MKKTVFFSLFFCSIFFCACSDETENSEAASADSMSVDTAVTRQPEKTASLNFYVSAAGTIYADNKIVVLDSVGAMLDQLKHEGGIVQYARANPQGPPAKEGLALMDQIAKRGLPVRFCTDSTFAQAAPMR